VIINGKRLHLIFFLKIFYEHVEFVPAENSRKIGGQGGSARYFQVTFRMHAYLS
jgi:hypothetical protein